MHSMNTIFCLKDLNLKYLLGFSDKKKPLKSNDLRGLFRCSILRCLRSFGQYHNIIIKHLDYSAFYEDRFLSITRTNNYFTIL